MSGCHTMKEPCQMADLCSKLCLCKQPIFQDMTCQRADLCSKLCLRKQPIFQDMTVYSGGSYVRSTLNIRSNSSDCIVQEHKVWSSTRWRISHSTFWKCSQIAPSDLEPQRLSMLSDLDASVQQQPLIIYNTLVLVLFLKHKAYETVYGEWHILRPSHLWKGLNYRLDKMYVTQWTYWTPLEHAGS